VKRLLTAPARFLLWPIRRFFDPRFQGLSRQLAESHEHLAESHERLAAQAEERRREAAARFFHSQERFDQLYAGSEERFNQLYFGSHERFDQLYVGQLDQRSVLEELHALLRSDLDATSEAAAVMSQSLADVLDAVDELRRRHRHGASGDDESLAVAERAYSLRASARLKPGSAVMQLGRYDESLRSSLAALGYAVATAREVGDVPTAEEIDAEARGGLGSARSALQAATLEAVFFLAAHKRLTIAETPSTGSLAQVRQLIRRGGTLVFTAHFEVGQDYRGNLATLFDSWQIEDLTYFRKQGDGTWGPEGIGDQGGGSDEVAAMVTATRTT
jgi:hypothetical protein